MRYGRNGDRPLQVTHGFTPIAGAADKLAGGRAFHGPVPDSAELESGPQPVSHVAVSVAAAVKSSDRISVSPERYGA
jgi:hypothetical protein